MTLVLDVLFNNLCIYMYILQFHGMKQYTLRVFKSDLTRCCKKKNMKR